VAKRKTAKALRTNLFSHAQFDALSIFGGSPSQSTPEPAEGAVQPPRLALLVAGSVVA